MKDVIKLLIGFFFICTIDITQIHGQIKENFSIKLGYSLSAQNWTDNFDIGSYRNPDNAIKALFGCLEYNQFINDKSKLSFGLQYVQKGFQSEYNIKTPYNNINVAYSNRLNYLELPIHYEKLVYTSKRFYNIKLKLGLVTSYLISSNYHFREQDDLLRFGSVLHTFYTNYAMNDTERYNRFDLGYSIGLVSSLSKYFDLDFTVEKGFIQPKNWPYSDMKYQQSFLLGIKYYFMLE